MSTCRSCGARITWLTAMSGKAICVDEDPVETGNIVVLGPSTTCMVYRNAEAAAAQNPDKPRYLSHFVTCPQAKEWRGRGASS